MKTFLAGLQTSVSSGTYVSTETSALGRANQKTVNSQSVIGPAITNFIDVETQTAVAPFVSFFDYVNNRLYVLSVASAAPTVLLYSFNASTGAFSYTGKVILSLGNAAATTYSFRGFKVLNNGSQINIVLFATGSVAINGGVYVAYGLSTANFTPGGTTLFAASGAGQTAVYLLQDYSQIGVANGVTLTWGGAAPFNASTSAFKTRIYALNNTVAAPQVYSWDLAIGNPTVAGMITNGVSSQTTLYTGTSPSAFFTMGASNNGYSLTNGDQVVLLNGTGNVPIGFTAWAPGTLQVAATNVYFVRDLQLVSGNYYFNLSSTSGGAAITPTSSSGSFSMMRAFGISTNLFYGRTPAFQALAGVLLQSNTVEAVIPTAPPLNMSLAGLDCLTFATTTQLYLGKISDLYVSTTGTCSSSSNQLTVGSVTGLAAGFAINSTAFPFGTTILSIAGSIVTTSANSTAPLSAATVIFGTNNWASLTGSNATGTGIDIVTPTVAFSTYSNEMDQFLYQDLTSTFIMKKLQNSGALTAFFGSQAPNYYETNNPSSVQLQMSAITGLDVKNGWMFMTGSATGQRGIIFADVYSDQLFNYSSIISPIQSVPPGTIFKYISALKQLQVQTDGVVYSIRNGASAGDAAFATATSGTWTIISGSTDLSAVAIGPFFQLRAQFYIASGGLSTVPSQVNDFVYTVQLPGESSIYWAASNQNTTQSAVTPMYVAWRLATAYPSGTVPTLFVRGYDDNGNLVAFFNSVTNASLFGYTTNNGTSWNALGTIPNTVATTEVRVLISSPPVTSSGRITWSISES